MSRFGRRYRRALFGVVAFIVFIHFIPSLTDGVHQVPPIQPHIGRVYIASNHWNSAHILPVWSAAILALVKRLGPENVYFSLYESGSWDDTKEHLRELDEKLGKLGVQRTITLDPTTHQDEIAKAPKNGKHDGWIYTPRNMLELRRIPYLARLRNIALEPLEDSRVNNATHSFDRILFLNDVVFTVDDVMNLLNTRNGAYAAACSLDFRYPGQFYDTFALRDADGYPAASQRYPYFGAGASHDAIHAGKPVPVRSCWNGMVSFDAAPFLPPHNLRFRGIPDSLAEYHLEGSECCLIHYDNVLSKKHGVYLNSMVRVGYATDAYESSREWPSWSERWRGWFIGAGTWIARLPRRDSKVDARLREWRKTKGHEEVGRDCLIDEMQVLVHNGWKHL